jgi:hypothetical protein
MISPGTFDRKISFCIPATTKTGMGAPLKSFVHSFYLYMSREPAPVTPEQYVNARLVVPGRYLYRGHYNAAINETYQIVDGVVKYNIISVNAIERNMFIEIITEKITE